MELQEAILSRRSTRAFTDAPVDDETLRMILEAGRYAPSGGNSQTTHFLAVRDRAVLDELAALVRSEFARMEITEGMYKSLANAIRASKSDSCIFHYNAPALIITANRIGYGNSLADCACALQNMMLMANALDMGSCWINQLRWLNENENICAFLRSLGMAQNEAPFGAMSLGHPRTPDGLPVRTPMPRTGNAVTYIG